MLVVLFALGKPREAIAVEGYAGARAKSGSHQTRANDTWELEPKRRQIYVLRHRKRGYHPTIDARPYSVGILSLPPHTKLQKRQHDEKRDRYCCTKENWTKAEVAMYPIARPPRQQTPGELNLQRTLPIRK